MSEALASLMMARELRLPTTCGRELVVTRWSLRDGGMVLRFTIVPEPGGPCPGPDRYVEVDYDEEFDVPAEDPGMEVLGLLCGLMHRKATRDDGDQTREATS